MAEEIIDPETKRRYTEIMELEARQYDELSQKVKEQEQQISRLGELVDEQGDRIDEHEVQIKSKVHCCRSFCALVLYKYGGVGTPRI